MSAASQMAALIVALCDSFASGDSSAWVGSLAPDALVIGTDEAEWWQGRDVFLPVMQAQAAEMSAAGIRLTTGAPLIATDGNTVWAADRLVLHLGDGTQVPARLTIVATGGGDRLVVRQMHLSLGAPNKDTIQQELTV